MQNDVEKAALEFQYYIFGNNIFIKTGSLHNMEVFIIVILTTKSGFFISI